MNDFSTHLKTVFRITYVFLSLCAAVYFLIPDIRNYILGLIVGILVSMVNSFYLSLKIKQLTTAVIHKTNRRVNMGLITRASMSVLAVIASLELEQLAFSTTLAGLFFTQVVTFLVGITSNLRNK